MSAFDYPERPTSQQSISGYAATFVAVPHVETLQSRIKPSLAIGLRFYLVHLRDVDFKCRASTYIISDIVLVQAVEKRHMFLKLEYKQIG